MGREPEAITTGEGGVWATNVEDETVSRIDPTDVAATPSTISVGDYPSDLTGRDGHDLGRPRRARRARSASTRSSLPLRARSQRSASVVAVAPRVRASRSAPVRSGSRAERLSWVASIFGRGSAGLVGLEAGIVTSSSSVLPVFEDVAFGLESLWIVTARRTR